MTQSGTSRKALALLLAMMMLFSLLPASAMAEDLVPEEEIIDEWNDGILIEEEIIGEEPVYEDVLFAEDEQPAAETENADETPAEPEAADEPEAAADDAAFNLSDAEVYDTMVVETNTTFDGNLNFTKRDTITINQGATLTVNGDIAIYNNKTLTFTGSGSVIVNGIINGNIIIDGPAVTVNYTANQTPTPYQYAVVGDVEVSAGSITLNAGNALSAINGDIVGDGVVIKGKNSESASYGVITDDSYKSMHYVEATVAPTEMDVVFNYLDDNGAIQTRKETCTIVTADDATLGMAGFSTWYVVNGIVNSASNITCRGTVNIVLVEGANWTVSYFTGTGANINIYATDANATLCADYESNIQNLAVYGGKVEAKAITATTVKVNGGKLVTVNEVFTQGGSVTVNGGSLTANGGVISGADIVVNGGSLTAESNGSALSATGNIIIKPISAGDLNESIEVNSERVASYNGEENVAITLPAITAKPDLATYNFDYTDEDGIEWTLQGNYTILNDSSAAWNSGNVVVVDGGRLRFPEVTVTGNVNLYLGMEAQLTAEDGINLGQGNRSGSLTVYGQTYQEDNDPNNRIYNSGALFSSSITDPAIRGNGTITIMSGSVFADGGFGATICPAIAEGVTVTLDDDMFVAAGDSEDDMLYYTNASFTASHDQHYAEFSRGGVLSPVFAATHQMILNEQIGLMFRLMVPQYTASISDVTFELTDGRSETAQVVAGMEGNCFICPLNVLELGDTITANYDGVATASYTALEYMEKIRNEVPAQSGLVNALQNYGHYMQNSSWTDSKTKTHEEILAVGSTTSPAAVKAEISGAKANIALGTSGIEKAMFALTLNDKTVINAFFDTEQVTITGAKVNDAQADVAGTRRISGHTYNRYDSDALKASELTTPVTFTAITAHGEATLTASPMSYVYAMVKDAEAGSETANQWAMAAFYDYAVAAAPSN